MKSSQAIDVDEQIPPKVFISYSWDSKEHKDKVLRLAQALRDDGIECIIDQFVQSPDNWDRWMLNQIDESQFVLMVCSERYYQRYRGHEEANKGLGVTWESTLIMGKLYNSQGKNSKFYPIFFDTPNKEIIPNGIRSSFYDLSRYDLLNLDQNKNRLIEEGDYKNLYRLLTNQPFVMPIKRGSLKKLETIDRQIEQHPEQAQQIKQEKQRQVIQSVTTYEANLLDLDRLIKHFYCNDPFAGTQALHQLVALGDIGEDALFSRPIEFKTIQVRRRWLRYVASRENTVLPRLMSRFENYDDASSASVLFAGIYRRHKEAKQALWALLDKDFPNGRSAFSDYGLVRYHFRAWGFAGQDPSILWQYVCNDSYVWEKLSTWAFYSACNAFARLDTSADWAIMKLITHEDNWPDSPVEINNSPDVVISNKAIKSNFLWSEAYYGSFSIWQRGEVVDQILRHWSRHTHWRVRYFGAEILASLGFQRTVTPVIRWLEQESVPQVRDALLYSLERSETASGADALLDYYTSSKQQVKSSLARTAWRATSKDRALAVLNAIVDAEDENSTTLAEAAVSLARLGYRHARLSDMLDSADPYSRLNAALALAYLNDKSVLEQVVSMGREAATPMERIYLKSAVAILGKPNGTMELNTELIAAADLEDFEKRVDLFLVHRYLKEAVLDALAAGGEPFSKYLNAWRAELEPLDPIPKPVLLTKPC